MTSVRQQAIDLLSNLSGGKITGGSNGKNRVKDLSKDGKIVLVSMVRNAVTLGGFTVTEKTTDNNIIEHFKNTTVSDLAVCTLNMLKEEMSQWFNEMHSDLEKVYGVSEASAIRAAIDVAIEELIFKGSNLKNISEVDFVTSVLESVEKLGITPADITSFNKSSEYYETTKKFNSRQMVNYLQANFEL